MGYPQLLLQTRIKGMLKGMLGVREDSEAKPEIRKMEIEFMSKDDCDGHWKPQADAGLVSYSFR
jgi:hypothetical protein